MGKFKIGAVGAIALMLLVGAGAWYAGSSGILNQIDQGTGTDTDTDTGGTGTIGFATTVKGGARNALTTAEITAGISTEIRDLKNKVINPNTNSTGASASLSTGMPNSFNGYMMIGNDANQQDSGTEYYLKQVPFSYNLVSPFVFDIIDVYPEATSLTLTGYEEYTSESTWNVTVGTSIVRTAKIKIEPAAGTCIGNPDVAYPLALCWNATTSNASVFNSIYPSSFKQEIAIPEALNGKAYVKCYQLNIPTAICDDKSGRYQTNALIDLVIDPASNPTVADSVQFSVLDATWYINDNNRWESGFADNSILGTDYDPGFSTTVTAATLNFA